MTRLLGPLVPDVIEVVCEMTGYTPDQLQAPFGPPRVNRARKIAYWAARQFGASNTEIARAFGRTHWTIQTGIEGVECDSSLKALAIEVAHEVQLRYGALPDAQRHDTTPVTP